MDIISKMVRLQNVTATRADRITSDKEERQRIGYDIQSTFEFAKINEEIDFRQAEVKSSDQRIARLRYGDTTTIWRINLGWKKRKHQNEYGFLLDGERGVWAINKDVDDTDQESPLIGRIVRVVPYVQNVRNALTFELEGRQDVKVMATLQAALKQGIQQLYQHEPNELAVEPLPNADNRNLLFLMKQPKGGQVFFVRLSKILMQFLKLHELRFQSVTSIQSLGKILHQMFVKRHVTIVYWNTAIKLITVILIDS